MPLDPKRTVAELKELRALTTDENGAQRVAFTPTWAKARKWLRSKVEETRAEIHNDAAGNFWAALRGQSDKSLLIGGHIDSVPNGGWLDGCLNTLAGVEILRRISSQYKGKPPVTVRLVDWCDEEGARFGKSLFGSSACSGKIDMNETRKLKDKDGVLLVDAVKEHGIDFEKVKDSGKELKNAAAYIELHIEQGPVLLDLDLPAYLTQRLKQAGVQSVEFLDACTYEREDDFFSYRRTTHRKEADYGRELSAIMLADSL